MLTASLASAFLIQVSTILKLRHRLIVNAYLCAHLSQFSTLSKMHAPLKLPATKLISFTIMCVTQPALSHRSSTIPDSPATHVSTTRTYRQWPPPTHRQHKSATNACPARLAVMVARISTLVDNASVHSHMSRTILQQRSRLFKRLTNSAKQDVQSANTMVTRFHVTSVTPHTS